MSIRLSLQVQPFLMAARQADHVDAWGTFLATHARSASPSEQQNRIRPQLAGHHGRSHARP